MMNINFIAVVIAALVPTLVGFVWYHPKVMGKVWEQTTGIDSTIPGNRSMPVVFGLSLLLSFLLAGSMLPITIHQMSVYAMVANEPGFNDPNSEIGQMLSSLMAKYGNNFRTLKHGALHGFMISLFFMLPIMGTNALFERKSTKYILVNAAYWAITLTLMGAIICAYA